MKVLVADDEPVSRQILEKTLTRLNYEVISAADGLTAWRILRGEDAPPLAILDWMMPGLDGVEVVKRLRLKDTGSYVFTILLTAKSETQDIVAGMEAGADDYLTKPFDKNELLARLQSGERILRLEENLQEKARLLETANQGLQRVNASMKHDLQAAARIQQTLLPNDIPQVPDLNIEWLYKPCDELAGDTLNVFPLDEKHLALYLLDVSGHGVSAALLSVTLSRILSLGAEDSNILRKKGETPGTYRISSPAEVADKLNRQFAIDIESGQYFTIIYGILNIETKEFTFVSAGHPNSILFKNGKPESFDNTGLPIGFSEEFQYEERTVRLNAGDRLFIYSDGINEAINPNQEQFTTERFVRSLTDDLEIPLNQSLSRAVEKVEQWAGEATLNDDISLLALELT